MVNIRSSEITTTELNAVGLAGLPITQLGFLNLALRHNVGVQAMLDLAGPALLCRLCVVQMLYSMEYLPFFVS